MRLQVGRRILELYEALRYQASHDPLTNVLNRGAIFKCLKTEISRSERRQSPLGVGLLDIDYFKRVNDTHGHMVGDIVLCEVVHRIGSALRDYDTIGRYGGEEFLIIVPGVDESSVLEVFDRVKRSICQTDITTGEEAKLRVTVSIGVCVYTKSIGIDNFISLADEALYTAKEEGRNCIRIKRPSASLEEKGEN